MKKKMFKLFKSEEEYLKNIIEDIDVNEEKYPLDFYKEHHHFKEERENNIINDIDYHIIHVTAFKDIIIGNVVYNRGNRYDYNMAIIYNRYTKEYNNYIDFSREYKNMGNGYYERMDLNGRKIVGEND